MRRLLLALFALSAWACPDLQKEEAPDEEAPLEEALKVELPKVPALPTHKAPTSAIKVRVGVQGALHLNGQPTSKAALKLALEKSIEKSADTAVLISATKEVPHGEVVELMDLAKLAGVKHVAIELPPK